MGYQTDQKNNKNIFQKKEKGQSFHVTLCKRLRKCAEMLKVNFANRNLLCIHFKHYKLLLKGEM